MIQLYSMKQIFNYLDYRVYLRDFYQEWKTKDLKYSYRYWASKAGFSSPNFIKLVIEKKRNLSDSGASQLAKALGLAQTERRFFMDLVELNQSKSTEARIGLAKRLLRNPALLKSFPLKTEQFEYYSQWYHVVLRELLLDPRCSQKPERLAARLRPKVTPSQIKESLRLLLNLGLIEKGPDGRLRATNQTVASGDSISNASLIQFHQRMIGLAKNSIENFSALEREISAATISISRENLEVVREMLRNCKREILMLAEQEKNPEVVMQVNFQMFPVATEDKD